MSIRSDHKTAIKTIMETLSWTRTIPVYDEISRGGDNIPFIFLTSGALLANRPSGGAVTLNSTGDYIRQYTYYINLLCQGSEELEAINVVEADMDTLEGLIMALLQKDSTRDEGSWQDLFVSDVSSPFNGTEIGFDSTFVVKTFTITVEHQFDRD